VASNAARPSAFGKSGTFEAGDARIAVVAAQLAGFGEFDGGVFAVANVLYHEARDRIARQLDSARLAPTWQETENCMSDKPDDPSAKGAGRIDEPPIDVFVSFARADKDVAHTLAKNLRDRGLSTWLDDDLQPGEEWDSKLRNVINKSRLCLVLVSEKASAHSPWVSKEWTLIQDTAWRRPDLSVSPVILDDADIPTFLRQWQVLRASRENARLEKAADGVAAILRRGLSQPPKEASRRDLSETAARFSEITQTLRESRNAERKG
jgi:hypothetical protein